MVHGRKEDQNYFVTMIIIRRIYCKSIDLPLDVFQGSLHCVVHGGREDQYLPRARQQHHKCRIAKHRPCQQDQIIDIVKMIRYGKAKINSFEKKVLNQ